MAIAERTLSTANATATTGTTLAVTPTGMVTDDLMVAVYAHTGGAGTPVGPAGWTNIVTVTQGGAQLSAWRKKAGASEAGPYQWDTQAAGNRRQALYIRAFSGVDPNNPLDGTATMAQSSSAASITHPASTSSGTGRFWLLASAKGTAAAATTTLNTPATFTETVDICSAHATLANINAGLHHKSVGSGTTGTQLVDSPDATNQIWMAVGLLLAPAGGSIPQADGAITGTLALSADATVVGSAPAATVTVASSVMGAGFQNTGCFAPLGVGHSWYAAIGGDVMGFHVTTDGVTWKPANGGAIQFGFHRVVGLEGSKTVADRLWGFCSTQGDGVGGSPGGRVVRGAFSASTGVITWTNLADTTQGAAGGVPDSGQPRQVGRLVCTDEANDTVYVGTTDGIARIQNLGGGTGAGTVTNARALAGRHITGMLLDTADSNVMWATADAGGTSPGFYRISNIRTGTVATTVNSTWTNPQDLAYVDAGGTRYVFVAAYAQGIRRWAVGADASTGWADVTNDYNNGGTGPSGIAAAWTGAAIKLAASNAGSGACTNAGAVSNDGGANWVNEVTGWVVSYIPWGETEAWWLSQDAAFMMMDQGRYDCASVNFDPANPARIHFTGRSGVDRSVNGGTTWRPSIRGQCATVAWTVAARPNFADQAQVGDADWTTLGSVVGFRSGMPRMNRPQTGTGMGVAYKSDGSRLAVAFGETTSGGQGEVWTTSNPSADNPTWTDEGFGAASQNPCHGMAIGNDASGTEVLLTVQEPGNIRRKVGGGAVATVQTGVGIGAQNPHFCWPNGHARRQWVFLSANDGLWRSSDHGATWTLLSAWTNNNEYTGNIHHDPGNLNTLYVTRDGGTAPTTGLFKVTNATGSPTVTLIGPVVTDPGPCAVDPVSGVVYLAVRAENAGGAKLYASPADNPGAGTTFVDITDGQWAAGPFAPADMCVTWAGTIIVSSKQGGYYTASRAGSVPVVLAEGTIPLGSGTGGSSGGGGGSSSYTDLYQDLYAADPASGVGVGDLALIADATVIPGTPGVVTTGGSIANTLTLGGSASVVTTAPPPPGVPDPAEPWFNGTYWPRVLLLAGLGGTLDPGADYLHLGVGPGLGTGKLGGANWVDLGGGVGTNIRSIAIQGRGKDGPLDAATPATATIVLNNSSGAYDPDHPSSPYAGLDIGTPIDVRAERPLGTIWRRFFGEVSSITLDAGIDPTVTIVAADGLEKLGRVQLGVQTVPIGDGDRSGQRVNRIANDGGYPSSLRRVDTGYTTVAPTIYGDAALELLRQVEQTETGFLFVDGAGTLVFYDRHQASLATRSTTVQATFSDADSLTQPGMVDLELDWSRDRTFNDVHITRDPVPNASFANSPDAPDEPVEQVAVDFATQAAWGTLSFPAQVGQVLRDDHQAAAMAQYLVGRFLVSQSRVRKITVNALRRDYWDTLLGLGLLDRIKVVRNYGPRTIVEELLIQGMTEEINSDPPTWTLTFNTTNPVPPPTLWRLGTSALGSGRLGW